LKNGVYYVRLTVSVRTLLVRRSEWMTTDLFAGLDCTSMTSVFPYDAHSLTACGQNSTVVFSHAHKRDRFIIYHVSVSRPTSWSKCQQNSHRI